MQEPIVFLPNLIYLLLMAGLWLSATGTYIPGTGIVEISGAGLLILTLYLMTMLTTNWIALIVLVLGASVFFLLPLLKPDWVRFAEVGLVVQAISSFFLFADATVSPILIVIALLLAWVYHHTILRSILKVQHELSSTQKDEFLVGARGRVVSPVDGKGTVHVKGEMWTARSRSRLEAGTEIVVTEQQGLELHVEKAKREYGE